MNNLKYVITRLAINDDGDVKTSIVGNQFFDRQSDAIAKMIKVFNITKMEWEDDVRSSVADDIDTDDWVCELYNNDTNEHITWKVEELKP